jgi:transposase-like protein
MVTGWDHVDSAVPGAEEGGEAGRRLAVSVEVLRERYAAGESVPSIAAGMGLTPRQVYWWMRKERINRRPPGAPMWDTFPISLEELRGWYEAGETIKGLARALGVSGGTVKMRLAESGATLRSRETPGGRMVLPLPSEVLRRRYEAGESLYDLAAELGVAVGTVKLRLLEAGTVMRQVGGRTGSNMVALPISAEELQRRRAAGESVAVLAAELGVSWDTVRKRLNMAAGATPSAPGMKAREEGEACERPCGSPPPTNTPTRGGRMSV